MFFLPPPLRLSRFLPSFLFLLLECDVLVLSFLDCFVTRFFSVLCSRPVLNVWMCVCDLLRFAVSSGKESHREGKEWMYASEWVNEWMKKCESQQRTGLTRLWSVQSKLFKKVAQIKNRNRKRRRSNSTTFGIITTSTTTTAAAIWAVTAIKQQREKTTTTTTTQTTELRIYCGKALGCFFASTNNKNEAIRILCDQENRNDSLV